MNTTNAAMQDSGVEWIGVIPKGWQLDRLKDVVSLRDEKSTEKSEVEDYLELEDLEQGTGRLLSVRNTTNVGSAVMKFYKGDVLFGKLRPYLQKYYLATFDGKCTGEILAFKPERITPEFLFYFIASDGFIKICTAMSYGTRMPRVSYTKQLAALPVCLPRVPEQQAIAQYLDERCGKLDKIIAIKQQQIKTLDALRQSIIYQAVTKGLDTSVPLIDSGVEWLGEIPKGWKVVRVKDVLDFYNTQRIPLSAADRGIMTNKEFDYYGASGIIDKVDNYLFDGVYTLVAEDGANLLTRNTPLAFIAKGKFWVNNHAHILKPRFGNINFFTHLLESMDYSLFVTGAAQPKLTKENLGRFKILNPPIAEQQAIADHLDQETQRLDQLKANLNQQINVLSDYKKSLIYESIVRTVFVTD